MSDKSELQKRDILRFSNEESNRLTRECLQTALIYLMNEKPFEKISITELVKRSGVSRTAFYRNYNSKEDILEEVAGDIVNSIIESLKKAYDSNDIYNWLLTFFRLLRNNDKTIRLLTQAGMGDRVSDDFNAMLKKYCSERADFSPYYLDALSGAMKSVIGSWIDDNMRETNENLAKICYNIFFAIYNVVQPDK